MEGPERPSSDAAAPAPVTFGGSSPIFRVRDLDAGVAYYVERLGFAVDWRYPGSIACVSRGRVSLFLCEGDQGTPVAWAWVGVSDAAALHDELRARGATVRQPPTNFSWAFELQVEDLDGNVLRCGSESKPGVAYGPWMDMDGVLWALTDAGSWERLSTAGVDTAGVAKAGVVTAWPQAVSHVVTTPAVSTPAVTTPAVPGLLDQATTFRTEAERARKAGDLAGARRLYEAAVARLRRVDAPLELAHALRHLGDVLVEDRQAQLARPHHAEALALARAHEAAPLELANAVRALAVVEQLLGDAPASRRLWEEAARLYQQVGVREGLAESAAWSARLAWRANDLGRARDWLAAARRAADATNDAGTWKFVREVGLELGG
jgi:catechol 2,3-dioxygenase-like lactoylglutathione lyase family enzyme